MEDNFYLSEYMAHLVVVITSLSSQ